MAMFRDFSFDKVSSPDYSRYEAERAAMNVSPTSPAMDPQYMPHRPPTPPPCTMGDLAVQLNQQSLRIDTTRRCYTAGPLTPDSDSDSDECASSMKQEQQARTPYSRIAASVLRMQRQQSSRMQCSPSHARDLSKLVKMIEEERQCTVSEPSSRARSTSPTTTCPSASSGDDEGVDMDYDAPTQSAEALFGVPVSRAGDRRDSCVRVTRHVRMRKRSKGNGVCKRSSS
ncbi:hypothetical protein ACET3X_006990 [Alternaria dauci]|uniref:Uncharacterized protein n=1 Tax=Alternaria dauci TaxID=48095 RepID=A0ABR3UFT3_9PLEO